MLAKLLFYLNLFEFMCCLLTVFLCSPLTLLLSFWLEHIISRGVYGACGHLYLRVVGHHLFPGGENA